MTKQILTFALIGMSTFFLMQCGGEEQQEQPADISEQVQQYNANQEYEESLELLRNANGQDQQVDQMLLQTHMEYGVYLTYEANDLEMTERMPEALRHFRRFLGLYREEIQ
jgi:tetratricopeptide (TPR) repeat protein